MTAVVRHPARYSDQVLVAMGQLVDQLVDDQGRTVQVLDPFAGTGRVHELGQHTSCELRTFGVELEPEWAGMHERTIVGDARKRPSRWTARFDVVATSPCYGNRMADHHEAKDPCRCRRDSLGRLIRAEGRADCKVCEGSGLSRRRTYTHDLGRTLTDGNAGAMQWGFDYRELHRQAWRETYRVLRPSGLFLLNVKDHMRGGERVHVTRWHRQTCVQLGFEVVRTRRLTLRGMRMGANRDRVPFETVFAMRKPEATA